MVKSIDIENKLNEFKPLKFTQQEILESIKVCLEVSPLIKPTNTLKNMVYHILKAYFIDGNKYVITECPTGSGKTIIGFMVYFCTHYLINHLGSKNPRPIPKESVAYFLTSSKILQNQIENDIDRFKFNDYLSILKGTANYPCVDNEDLLKNDAKLRETVKGKFGEHINYLPYNMRPCKGMNGKQLTEKYNHCVNRCPYKNSRNNASTASCTVLNYAYFLNVRRGVSSYFDNRILTISDEAHLIPDIVTQMFNHEISPRFNFTINKLCNSITSGFGYVELVSDIQQLIGQNGLLFNNQNISRKQIVEYFDCMIRIGDIFEKLKIRKTNSGIGGYETKQTLLNIYREDFEYITEIISGYRASFDTIKDIVENRPQDLYLESEDLENGTFKFIIKDLKEAEMVKRNFLDKIHYGLFMSATLGDMDEYAELMGIKKGEYASLMLPSSFDFTNSPIYLTSSGYLNYNSFENNIDNVLMEAIRICQKHPNEKGIIHTGTFHITKLLYKKLSQISDKKTAARFKFYNNSQQKETQIDRLKRNNAYNIVCGPSLYEGIDLPDDDCRFQIMIKVPYASLTGYIKKKQERYPFWYKRNCVEKVTQAIGRSNRHKKDYSTIYLLDTLFDKIIFDTPDYITNRLEYKKIY